MSPRGGWRSLLSAATLRLLFRGSFDFRPTRARLGAAVAYAALPVTNVAVAVCLGAIYTLQGEARASLAGSGRPRSGDRFASLWRMIFPLLQNVGPGAEKIGDLKIPAWSTSCLPMLRRAPVTAINFAMHRRRMIRKAFGGSSGDCGRIASLPREARCLPSRKPYEQWFF